VADDSESERASARIALMEAGYQVVEAVDGQHALEVFARERPDVVLLDVVMPRLTGLETCRILKSRSQSTYLPVIMVSTRNSVNARVEGLRSGADDYLGKPYDPEELRTRVETLLRARRFLSEAHPQSLGGEPPTEGVTHDSTPADSASFRRRMEEEFDRAERYSDPLACLRVELDDYEALATRSREAADRGVSELRVILHASVRKIDHIFPANARGYVVVLPNTHFPGALAVAERIWKDARKLRLSGSDTLTPTVSIGVSFYPNKDIHSLQNLLDVVDAALERACREGGGRICLYQHQGYLYAPEDNSG
jgi:diguanylate cyclase (GGDEF)-like protein